MMMQVDAEVLGDLDPVATADEAHTPFWNTETLTACVPQVTIELALVPLVHTPDVG